MKDSMEENSMFVTSRRRIFSTQGIPLFHTGDRRGTKSWGRGSVTITFN